MAGQQQNWIADKFLRQQRLNQTDLGQLRRARQFDRNNYERVTNDVTSRLTSDPSKRLAIAQGLGLPTAGLIIGGQVGKAGGGEREGNSATKLGRSGGGEREGNSATKLGRSGGTNRDEKNKNNGIPTPRGGQEPLEGF